MAGVPAIAGMTGALNSALNICKSLLGIRDQAMIQEKIVELTGQIISAQQSAMAANAAQLDLLEKIRDFEKQIIEMKT